MRKTNAPAQYVLEQNSSYVFLLIDGTAPDSATCDNIESLPTAACSLFSPYSVSRTGKRAKRILILRESGHDIAELCHGAFSLKNCISSDTCVFRHNRTIEQTTNERCT
jgi:hypothetical protein